MKISLKVKVNHYQLGLLTYCIKLYRYLITNVCVELHGNGKIPLQR